jgi:hypothetical protein
MPRYRSPSERAASRSKFGRIAKIRSGKQLIAASQRLAVVVPLTLLSIFAPLAFHMAETTRSFV